MPCCLRPLDEVGDDQEVAGEAHPLDDAELELEPLAVVLDASPTAGSPRGGRRGPRAPAGAVPRPRPRRSAAGSACASSAAKAQRRAISTVFSIASGRSAKSATISSWRLEAVLGRQPPPRLLLVDIGALGDADHRVVRLVHRRAWGNRRRWWRRAAGRGHRRASTSPGSVASSAGVRGAPFSGWRCIST